MTSRADRLQPAVDQAEQRREHATGRLAEAQQRVARAEHQLEELRQYRKEYAALAGGGVSVTALLNRQSFVERIDQAIVQQDGELERQRRQLEMDRGSWRSAHAREQALDSVVAGYREQARKAEDRQEQNEIDERMQYRRSGTF